MIAGITGSIGSGKSTVCAYLRSRGYYVFSCDDYNALLLEKGNAGYVKVRSFFPDCFDGEELNKKKLAEAVFSDPVKREVLENLLHPLIIKGLNEAMDRHEPFFGEVPLLFECNLDNDFDEVLLVTCDEDIALERLEKRGLSREEALARLKNQMPVENKIRRSNTVIYNNGSIEDLYEQIEDWLEELEW